jgi:hypothetical protein
MTSLDDSSLLQRSTKPPGMGNEMTGRPVVLLCISLGKSGRGLLKTPSAEVSSCIDDRTLILLIRCASELSEWCMVKATSGSENVVLVLVKERATYLYRMGHGFISPIQERNPQRHCQEQRPRDQTVPEF